jgi:hypothetical protein
MVVASMVVTLSASMSTLNIGRAKANIQFLKKAQALSMTQVISMYLGDSELCNLSVDSQAMPAITPSVHLANDGIPMRVFIQYPAWKTNTSMVKHPSNPSGGASAKLLPLPNVAGKPEDSQFGDSSIYVKSIRFKLPMNGNQFDRSFISTYTVPNEPFDGTYKNITRYEGQLIIDLGDNSNLPAPLAPSVFDFVVNVDETNTPHQFYSCSADRGLEEFCNGTMGCQWRTLDLDTGQPLAAPFCECANADVPECTGPNEYISDIDPVTGQRECRTFHLDCGDPAAVPLTAPNRNLICYGNPERCHGIFLAGIEDGTPVCVNGGFKILEPIDCPAQTVYWVVGSDYCQASIPYTFETASRTITDSTDPSTGTGTFRCERGQMVPSGPLTCDSPDPVYHWHPGDWSGCPVATATPTPTPTAAPSIACWRRHHIRYNAIDLSCDHFGPISTFECGYAWWQYFSTESQASLTMYNAPCSSIPPQILNGFGCGPIFHA